MSLVKGPIFDACFRNDGIGTSLTSWGSGHGAKEAHRKSRSMDRYRQREPDRVFCEWHHSRQGRRPCRPHRALVEWPDRRADHEAKAGKTPNVWTGEDRPPASPTARRHLVT